MISIKNKLKKSGIKDSSIASYLATIKKLGENLGFKRFNVKYLADHESVISYINDNPEWSLATKRNYTTAVIVATKDSAVVPEKVREKYLDYLRKLTETQTEQYADNKQTPRERENWITGTDISDKVDEYRKLKEKAKTDHAKLDSFQKYLILCLYTMLPPMRNDFAGEMVVYSKKQTGSATECNSICLETSKLILCNYKTSKHYGKKVIDIPDELTSVIKDWIQLRKGIKAPTKYLLVQLKNPGEFMKKNHLTKTLNSIFHPKKVSTTLLRKIYISEKYPVTHTFREMQKDAFIMSHDISMAKQVYTKKLE